MNEYGSFSGVGLTGKSQSTRRKTCTNATLSITNQMDWPGIELGLLWWETLN